MRSIFIGLLVSIFSADVQQASAQPSPEPSPELTTAPLPTITAQFNSPGGVCDHLVDGTGRALYAFDKDTSTRSNCVGPCAIEWPPLNSPLPALPTVVFPANKDLAGLPVPGEQRLQSIYAGHLLYTYRGDVTPVAGFPSESKGHCLNSFEGKWQLIQPNGDLCSCDGAASVPAPVPQPVPTTCSTCGGGSCDYSRTVCGPDKGYKCAQNWADFGDFRCCTCDYSGSCGFSSSCGGGGSCDYSRTVCGPDVGYKCAFNWQNFGDFRCCSCDPSGSCGDPSRC